jgi:4Fe-4S single cluster domain
METNSKAEEIELYLILSDLCNFECNHCLSSSGPKSKYFRLESGELLKLAEMVNSNPKITAINFSGGEPTLQTEMISKFQSKINRPIHYTVTTNGWLGGRLKGFLDKVKVQSITLSYDKWHKPFVLEQTLVEFVSIAVACKIPVDLNIVFENIIELSIAGPLVEAGAKLNATHVIPCGRANELTVGSVANENAISGSCPSNELEMRNRGVRKLTYFPQKGFSICCGPLAFDGKREPLELYAKEISDIDNTFVAVATSGGSFKEQASRLGLEIEHIPFRSRCEACSFLYAKNICGNRLSIQDLALQQKEVAYYPKISRLTSQQEQALRQAFHVKYFHLLAPEAIPTYLVNSDVSPAQSIHVADILQEGVDVFTDFTEETFYDRNGSDYSLKDREIFLELAKGYFQLELFGNVYRKNGKVVGLISTHRAKAHPATGTDLLHIGYWGYDRDSLTKEEARWIKQDWTRGLLKWSQLNGNIPVDASVDFFNKSAFNLTAKMGFKVHSLRLDRKPV